MVGEYSKRLILFTQNVKAPINNILDLHLCIPSLQCENESQIKRSLPEQAILEWGFYPA